MSIALDAFDVLERIGKNPSVFVTIRADADKAARALVVKCLKAKSVDLDGLRKIRKAFGPEPFGLLVEGLKDADVKSVLTRLDKHQPEVKSGSVAWRRQHLEALADNRADPARPAAKAVKKTPVKKAKASKAEAAPRILQSDVADMVRQAAKKKG